MHICVWLSLASLAMHTLNNMRNCSTLHAFGNEEYWAVGQANLCLLHKAAQQAMLPMVHG